MKDIGSLVADGILRPAALPPGNGEIGTGPLTVPLIAEDYPAKTAVMWNAAYARFDVPGSNCMLVGDPAQSADILRAFRADARYQGGGAGIGFKEAVVPLLDDLTPLARAMGSVNIIRKMEDGSLVGDNTDGRGYAESLADALGKSGRALEGATILLLGAGGTGRAIAFALAQEGASLVILNRTAEKAARLADEVNAFVGASVAEGGSRERIPGELPRADAIVSVVDDAHSPLDAYAPLGDMPLPATPDSIAENRAATERLLHAAKPGVVVSDIRIRREETPMLAAARALGLPTLDGIPMVINQGAAAFWWLYEEPLRARGISRGLVTDVMREAAGQ